MSGYGMALQQYGMHLGQVKLIISTMRKQGWDVEKAMDVDPEDRSALAESVREELSGVSTGCRIAAGWGVGAGAIVDDGRCFYVVRALHCVG